MVMFNWSKSYPQGLTARKKIAKGKASLRVPPWVNRPQDLQVLNGRLNGRHEFAREPKAAAKGLTWSLKIRMLARPVEMRFIRGNESLCPEMQKC